MFASSKFIESRTNQAKLETPQKLFDLILRYLYNQDPFTDITSFITDVIQEASYFELNDFEQSLWELFEKKADANNCIKAILMDSNALFEMRKPIIMK
jgi:FPC/CPF motif-containing protein YcgG